MGVPAQERSLRHPDELLDEPVLCGVSVRLPRVLTGVSCELEPAEDEASSSPSARLGARHESSDRDSEEGVVACDGPWEPPPGPPLLLPPAMEAMLKDRDEASMSMSS